MPSRAGAQGEFAALVDLLTRQFAGAAAARIRRANFLDLAAQALESCRRRLDEAMPRGREPARGHRAAARRVVVGAGRADPRRAAFRAAAVGGPTAGPGRVAVGLQSLLARVAALSGHRRPGLRGPALSARTPAQLALWGVVEGARSWQRHRRNRQLQQRPGQAAAGGFDAAQLRRAAVVLEGYAAEAGLPKAVGLASATLQAEADAASLNFAARLSQDLDALIARQAQRHTGWFTRWRYEILLLAMLGFLLFRLGKNFFYDSWWPAAPAPMWGVESYIASAFWLVLWCFVLLWLFTRRFRGGLKQAIDRLAESWTGAAAAAGVFAELEDDCRRAIEFRRELELLQGDVERVRGRV